MTRDDIIRMAKEAGGAEYAGSKMPAQLFQFTAKELERFHALAVAAEREACAKVCESLRDSFLSPRYATGQPMSSIRERFAAGRCAELIRERGINDT